MTKEKKKITKKWWFWAIIVVLAIGVINGIVNGGKDTTTQTPQNSASPSASESQEPSKTDELYNDTETKDAIKADVEALVDDSYKGNGYTCDILTRTDGSGYIVSLQIDAGVKPPESTEIISNLEEAVKGLNNDKIVEIQIVALKAMQIVDKNY